MNSGIMAQILAWTWPEEWDLLMFLWMGLSVLSLWGLGKIWQHLPLLDAKDSLNNRFQNFGLPETGLAAGLSLWFVGSIALSGKAPHQVTPEGILQGGILYGTLILGIAGFLRLRHHSILLLFGLQRNRWWVATKRGGCCFVLVYPLFALVLHWTEYLASPGQIPDPLVQYLQHHPPFWMQVGVAFLAIIIAPITEELIFRGFLYGVFRHLGGRLAAMGVTSLLFAGIHLNTMTFLPLLILGFGLALAYEWAQSLWASLTVHVIFNSLTLVWVFLG